MKDVQEKKVEPTAMEVVLGLATMLDREPTREEIVAALGVPLVYKDAQEFTPEQHIVPYLKKQGRTDVSAAGAAVAPTRQDMLLGEMFCCFAEWHHDRNLIEGATDQTQFVKLLEEVVELYMSICKDHCNLSPLSAKYTIQKMIGDMYDRGRIKLATDSCILDDVGDINVVLTNLLARRSQSMGDALLAAWNDIKDRKGTMVDGVFVKEGDLLSAADLEKINAQVQDS
jgi:hypothetical protein